MRRKITIETIRHEIDLDVVRRIMAECAELGDYERRLLEMGLRAINRNNAKYLPPKAYLLLDFDEGPGEG